MTITTPDRSPRFKAALIDMDGVLYDSMKLHTLAWQRLMDEENIPTRRDDFYLYEGMTGKDTINLVWRRFHGQDAPCGLDRTLYARKTRYFNQLGAPEVMPGAADMLRAFARAGVKRVLVTGSGQLSVLERIDRDFPGAFAPLDRVTACDVNRGKPDPEPYLRGLEKAGIAARDAIVVENAPLGVKAGKAAGCFTVAITTGPIPREEFRNAGADLIFPSMPEFAESLPDLLNDPDSFKRNPYV